MDRDSSITMGEFRDQHWAHALVFWLLEYQLARERKDWPFADFTRDSFAELGLKLEVGAARIDVVPDFPAKIQFTASAWRRGDDIVLKWMHDQGKTGTLSIQYSKESS